MKFNEVPFMIVGMSSKDFLKWCKKNEKRPYEKKSRVEFFKRIHNHELIKSNNKLIEKGEEY